MRTRMPFKFGITTMTAIPHLFLSVELGIDGTRAKGLTADHLPQKWLTKNPKTTVREDVAEMLGGIRHAGEIALALPPAANPFELWQEVYARPAQLAGQQGVPPVPANLGGA